VSGQHFRGFGDPTQLRILTLLRAEGELTVAQLVDRLALPQPTVSAHLARLRSCGFLTTWREHRTVFNRINDARVLEMLDLANALLDNNAQHVASCCTIDTTHETDHPPCLKPPRSRRSRSSPSTVARIGNRTPPTLTRRATQLRGSANRARSLPSRSSGWDSARVRDQYQLDHSLTSGREPLPRISQADR
jgi:DNA-binding transcriptional ArsR family regulator